MPFLSVTPKCRDTDMKLLTDKVIQVKILFGLVKNCKESNCLFCLMCTYPQ